LIEIVGLGSSSNRDRALLASQRSASGWIAQVEIDRLFSSFNESSLIARECFIAVSPSAQLTSRRHRRSRNLTVAVPGSGGVLHGDAPLLPPVRFTAMVACPHSR
jgi:hypothetical protein